jgi:chromosomal replication initiation ATPase DnaA
LKTKQTKSKNKNGTQLELSLKFPIIQKKEEIDIFGVNTRFEYLGQLTKMVIKKETPSLFITGEGGLGKSHTVLNKVNKLLKPKKYKVIKGYSTPRGLYNALFDNNNKLIIFDDCDAVLEAPVSLNLLKTALDSYDTREITWNTQMRKGDPYPQSFIFTGRIIFISNKERKKINQPLISRSMVVDLTMTPDEKIERMRSVLKKVEPKIPLKVKEESLDLITKNMDEVKDLNFRTLIKVSKIRNSFPKKWEGLAKYSMLEG